MLKTLLVIHLAIALSLAITFIYRIAGLIRHQNSPFLRKLFYVLSALIVISGTALSIVGKVPITNICLESLGIVAVVSLLDFVLVIIGKKLEQAE